MAKAMKVTAEPRSATGTGAVRRLRRTGQFPGVVYGGEKTQNVQLNEHEFARQLGGHSSESMLMDLDIQGVGLKKVLLKDVQHHPISGHILHADFLEVSMTRKLRVELPIQLKGEPVGVSQGGGVLEHILRVLQVECLPGDIVDHVDLDVSALGIAQSLTVKDIKLDPAKYTILTGPDVAVAAVAVPREEEVVEATPEAGAAEPEVLREKKVEGEEGEEEEGKEGKPAAGKEAKPAAGKEAKPAAAGAKDAKPAAGAKDAGPKAAGKEGKK